MEVLLAMGIVVLVLVSLSSAAIVSLKNSSFSQNTVLANKYALEAIETARKERDRQSWSSFTANFSGNKGLNSALVWNGCSSANIGIFTRCVNFSNNNELSTVTATVSWQEAGQTHSSQAVTVLSKWN